MAEPDGQAPRLPEREDDVTLTKKRGLSMVWVIPIVAAVVAGWLVYTTFAEKGPVITITFKTAEGLDAGKTKIKFKDVEVGTVTAVNFGSDLSKVVVTAELAQEVTDHLSKDTRFWVVKPRLTASGVSGLSTLVSGSYVEIDPVAGAPIDHFVGLENPPVVRSGEAGREFLLKAATLGSIGRGSPIYFRGIAVGEVLGHELKDDNTEVEIRVFVNDPHSNLIRPGTRFWNASGFSASVGADGVRIAMQSMTSLLSGGIAFETPPAAMLREPSPEDSEFRLFESYERQQDESFTQDFRFISYFEGSVRGLTIGAPVEFRGIRVGTVSDVSLEFNDKGITTRIPVTYDIEPERVKGAVQTTDPYKRMARLVKRGLRAKLRSGSLITGQLLVDLDVHDDAKPAELKIGGTYPEIPTLPADLDQITQSVNGILTKLAALPLEDLVDEIRKTVKSADTVMSAPEIQQVLVSVDQSMQSINSLVQDIDQDAGPLIDSLRRTSDAAHDAVVNAQSTLASANEVLDDNSVVRHNLESMLAELSEAAAAIRNLANYLEQHPEALVRGKGG